MQLKLFHVFRVSAGILLLITGAAKIISGCGNADILKYTDPIFKIPFRELFWIVGTLEIGTALTCFFCRRLALAAGLVAWMATNFAIYRFCMMWVGYHRPCSCLGNLTDALHISPEKADLVMKIILAYLLAGSYLTVIWLWKGKQKNLPEMICHERAHSA